MKKTIAALAMIASTNALAIAPPPPGESQPEPTTVCFKVNTYKSESGKLMYAGCNETRNNIGLNRPILENGCAKGQVSLTVVGKSPISSCMPPGMVQL